VRQVSVSYIIEGVCSNEASDDNLFYWGSRVSALVHSSTLVTAGVYLLIRFRPSFRCRFNTILFLVSGLTVFIAGLGANFEFDLKKIIALSILRQMGLMIMTISVGLSGLAFFHLLTHAFLKALLFMFQRLVWARVS
jgi:NADH-ubiquinone oxidoreductase chain 5